MATVNVMENLVMEKLAERLAVMECCKCDRCINDMLAVALNELQPKYVNTRKGELFTRIDATKQQNAIDLDVAITKAIETVTAAPHKD
ncbi:MAG: late competence development ComFB family protein [Oscillospiraceae bacterium]|nr:late competence development ComFB family protein [Oscillospiraceae bacterium]